jgi:hypothetical protein
MLEYQYGKILERPYNGMVIILKQLPRLHAAQFTSWQNVRDRMQGSADLS